MLLLQYLKQQNWKYAIPCFAILLALNFCYFSLEWKITLSFAFIVLYSLKYANKTNNELIDLFKLLFYFVYFTLLLLSFDRHEYETIIYLISPFVLFSLYLISFLIHYNAQEYMNTKNKRSILIGIIIIQTILSLGVGVLAITQKVEAEKQMDAAVMALEEAEKQKDISEKLKMEIELLKTERNKKSPE